MNIISLLICFGFDKFLPGAESLRNYQWIEKSWVVIYQQFFSNKTPRPEVVIAVALLPFLLLTGLVQIGLHSFFYGFFGFLFNIVVLFYCLGTINVREQFAGYFAAKERGDYPAAQSVLGVTTTEVIDEKTLAKTMMDRLLIGANQQLIGVIFWFLILGAFGALLYRLSVLMHQYSRTEGSPYAVTQEAIDTLQGWLDWIPARLLALGYALAGNFVNTFSCFLRYMPEKPANNDAMLVECGLAALNNLPSASEPPAVNEQMVMDLIDRVLVIALVSIALMTLGAWIS